MACVGCGCGGGMCCGCSIFPRQWRLRTGRGFTVDQCIGCPSLDDREWLMPHMGGVTSGAGCSWRSDNFSMTPAGLPRCVPAQWEILCIDFPEAGVFLHLNLGGGFEIYSQWLGIPYAMFNCMGRNVFRPLGISVTESACAAQPDVEIFPA